jgi:DNA-binding transcriptional MerR regulator/methylmalonyl-CoA mutase cobalamin-binding subunit
MARSEREHGPTYSIGALSRLTGLSADVIRSWERRYGIVQPERAASGVRVYRETDLTRLRLARDATRQGHPIRLVATMSDETLQRLAANVSPEAGVATGDDAAALLVERVVAAIAAAEPWSAERLLVAAALAMAPRSLVLDVLLPLLHEVGDRWERGTFAVWQEHLISDLLRSVVRTWSTFERAELREPPMVFATPPDELHEFGIVLASMLAGARGIPVVRLGANVPPDDLLAAAQRLDARCLVVGLVRTELAPADIDAFVARVAERLPPHTELWLGGAMDALLTDPPPSARIVIVKTLEDFDRLVASYAVGRA